MVSISPGFFRVLRDFSAGQDARLYVSQDGRRYVSQDGRRYVRQDGRRYVRQDGRRFKTRPEIKLSAPLASSQMSLA
jgi:hypothetical protein